MARPAVIDGMIDLLPAPGSSWPDEERQEWLAAMAAVLRIAYPPQRALPAGSTVFVDDESGEVLAVNDPTPVTPPGDDGEAPPEGRKSTPEPFTGRRAKPGARAEQILRYLAEHDGRVEDPTGSLTKTMAEDLGIGRPFLTQVIRSLANDGKLVIEGSSRRTYAVSLPDGADAVPFGSSKRTAR